MQPSEKQERMKKIDYLCQTLLNAGLEVTKGRGVSRQEMFLAYTTILSSFIRTLWDDAPDDEAREWVMAEVAAFGSTLPWMDPDQCQCDRCKAERESSAN